MRTSPILLMVAHLCATISIPAVAEQQSSELLGPVAGQTPSEKLRSSQPKVTPTAKVAPTPTAKVAPTADQIRKELRQKVNSGLVGLVLGVTESESSSKVSELFASLERDESLRIFQVEGKGAAQNVIELGFARGIDAGIIQSDILDSFRRIPVFPGIESYLQYVAKLYDKEVHVLAASDVNSIEDLRGTKVNFGPLNSDDFVTATRIFGNLGIDVEPTKLSHALALEKLRQGEIVAMVYVAAKPADLFNFGSDKIEPAAGMAAASAQPSGSAHKLHFVSIPSKKVRGGYAPTNLRAEDYPALIEQDKPIETLAVGSILMVYNWSRGTDRYRKVTRFVERLLEHTNTQAHYPAWPEVDVSASLPGWTRFAPAEQWIKAHSNEQRNHALLKASENGSAALKLNRAELNDLFTEFVEYQKQQQVELFTQFVEYQKQQQTSNDLIRSRSHALLAAHEGR